METGTNANSKKKLFIFTDGFPYGKGEKPFVGPEIEFLRHNFDVTIVSNATSDLLADTANASELPENVGLCIIRKKGKLRRAMRIPSIFFSKAGRREVKKILATKEKVTGRLVDAFKRYANAMEIRRFCRAEGLFDDCDNSIFYSYWLVDYAFALALEKESRTDLRLISRTHGYDLFDFRNENGRQPFQESIIAACNALVFASEKSKKYLAEHPLIRMPSDISYVNRIGTEATTEQPGWEKPRNGRFRLVSCSNVIPLKRVELIAEALTLLDDYDIDWIHFGEGESLAKLKAYASDHDLNATFAGYASNDKIKQFYQNQRIDAFISTSSTEGGCPVSISEALSFGIPIIGTDVGGISEQIEGNGILLSANPTAKEVAAAIQKMILQDGEHTMQMRCNSKRIWEQRFNRDANLQALEAILQNL